MPYVIPAGYRLGHGWEIVPSVERDDWACSMPRGSGDDCSQEARLRHTAENERHPIWCAGVCEDLNHAVELGALVKL